MSKHISPEHSGRIRILALAGWTPQEIANEFPDYHADQIRNHLNRKYDDVKGKIKKDTSRGNSKIKFLLQEIYPNAKVEMEFPIGKKLRLDAYIGEPYNLGFEYDGVQHSKAVDHFGGDETYIKGRLNDEMKEDLCKGRGISLVRISHLDNLDEELLRKKIDEAGFGSGIIQDDFKTSKEKQKEKQERLSTHAKRIAKVNYEKNKQKIKGSSYHQAQKERAKAIRKENYQRSKSWAASRNNKS